MVQLSPIIIFFLCTFVVLVHSTSSGTTTHPKVQPEHLQQLPQRRHNISKRFIKFPFLLPVIVPRKPISITYEKRYTNLYSPILPRYKRSLPSIQASSQTVIATNPTIDSSSITFLDGSHLWDHISAILALLQSLQRATQNIYQSTDLQAILEWNQKAMNLLARVGAFGAKFVPTPPVQNNTELFNLAAVVPLKKFIVPKVNITGSVGIHKNTLGMKTNGTTQIPLAAIRKSVGNDKSAANIKIDAQTEDIARVFSGKESSEDEEYLRSINDNLLGRRRKRSIGTFARAQANFRRILPSFEGLSSNWQVHRNIPQYPKWSPQYGGRKIPHHHRWEFPRRDNYAVKEKKPANEVFENTSDRSDVEVEEFNFLPHFERRYVFYSEIERDNKQAVEYPFSIKENQFRNNNEVYVQVSYSKPELIQAYVEDGNVNGGDFKALPNFQTRQKFIENQEDFSINPRFNGEFLEDQNLSPVRHTFVEAPRPIEQTRPFVPQLFADQKSLTQITSQHTRIKEPSPFVEAKPHELFVTSEQETFEAPRLDTKVTPHVITSFLNTPTGEFEEVPQENQDTNEDDGKSLDDATFRMKNRLRKVELKDEVGVVEVPDDLARRPSSDYFLARRGGKHGDAKEYFDKRNFVVDSQVVLDDAKRKIGRRVVYKRIKTREEN